VSQLVVDGLEIIKSVKCCVCGAPHDVDSQDYLVIVGNVMAGNCGGLIGNNFCDPEKPGKEWDITGMTIEDIINKMRKTVVCRDSKCVWKAFGLTS